MGNTYVRTHVRTYIHACQHLSAIRRGRIQLTGATAKQNIKERENARGKIA